MVDSHGIPPLLGLIFQALRAVAVCVPAWLCRRQASGLSSLTWLAPAGPNRPTRSGALTRHRSNPAGAHALRAMPAQPEERRGPAVQTRGRCLLRYGTDVVEPVRTAVRYLRRAPGV